MLRTLAFSAALFAASSTIAFAQDANSTNTGRSTATNSSLTTDHWLASDVYGAKVYDKDQNKIGDISDLVINKDGTISKAVIGVGGFLGVGQKDVAIPFNQLKVASNSDSTWLVLDTTKDQLKAAPAYDKNAANK